MKKLFEFELDREVSETVSNTEKNEKGETITTEKKIEKTIKQKIFLRKPNRSLYDEAELFYGVKLSEGIKAGLLTRALLAKRFSNDGGVLSEDEKDRYADLYLKLYETQLDIERLSMASKSRSKKESKKLDNLLTDSAEIRRELTDFEMAQSSLFEQTAENRARNKTILWWVLHLSHFKNAEGEDAPIFLGDTFDDKLDAYDVYEESEELYHEQLLQKLIYYVSFWYVGKVSSQDEFETMLKEAEEKGEEEEEEPKAEKPKAEKPKVEEPKVEEPKTKKDLDKQPREKSQDKDAQPTT